MNSTIQEYLDSLRGKRIAVIGIGVSNTPLIKMLLRAGLSVTACDKKERKDFDGLIEELESLGAEVRLGPDYMDGLDQDIIFRTPGLRPDVTRWRCSSRSVPVRSSLSPEATEKPLPPPLSPSF